MTTLPSLPLACKYWALQCSATHFLVYCPAECSPDFHQPCFRLLSRGALGVSVDKSWIIITAPLKKLACTTNELRLAASTIQESLEILWACTKEQKNRSCFAAAGNRSLTPPMGGFFSRLLASPRPTQL